MAWANACRSPLRFVSSRWTRMRLKGKDANVFMSDLLDNATLGAAEIAVLDADQAHAPQDGKHLTQFRRSRFMDMPSSSFANASDRLARDLRAVIDDAEALLGHAVRDTGA